MTHPHPLLLASPEDAEAAFYEAIERADLEKLMAIWSEDEEITCVQPSGQRLVGHAEVREAWRQILGGALRLHVRISHVLSWTSGIVAVRNVLETLYVEGDPTPHGPLLATNVYMRGSSGWRLLVHHASAASEPLPSGESGAPKTLH